jgi:hypothetical protein
MISSASSFQRRQPRSVSMTLAPTNPHRTFASTKFQRTSGDEEVMRIRRRLRWLPRLRRLLRNSGELFRRRRSSLVEGEHIIAFVSPFPFRFVVPVHVLRSSPLNPHPSSSLWSICSRSRHGHLDTSFFSPDCNIKSPGKDVIARRFVMRNRVQGTQPVTGDAPEELHPRRPERRPPPSFAKSGHLCSSLPLGSTSLRSPRSPLSVPWLSRAPSRPEP